MATPESLVKAQVKRILADSDVYFFMPPGSGYGRAGIPDVVGCVRGKFLAIECKAGKGKTTALQDRELCSIHAHGGTAVIINETNIDTLKELIDGL